MYPHYRIAALVVVLAYIGWATFYREAGGERYQPQFVLRPLSYPAPIRTLSWKYLYLIFNRLTLYDSTGTVEGGPQPASSRRFELNS